MPPSVRDRWSGDGHCGFCLQSYLFQLELHCAECDRPVCPLCAKHGRESGLCPGCANGAAGERD